MNKNDTETNQDILEEVIYYWTDNTYPVVMEDIVNEEQRDIIINDLLKENDT